MEPNGKWQGPLNNTLYTVYIIQYKVILGNHINFDLGIIELDFVYLSHL